MRYCIALFLMLTGFASGIQVENGATDVITYFVMRDQTAGTMDTGITIANLEMYYIEDQVAISADVFVGVLATPTTAHTDGRCIHVGRGRYRVDWPDAAFDGGVGKRVQLILVDGDGGAFEETLEVELSPPGNVTQLDGSDIQQASGYIKVSDGTGTGQIQLTSGAVDVVTIETGDATDALNTEADNAIITYKLDHLVYAADGDDPADDSIMAKLAATDGDWSNFSETTDSLQSIRDAIGLFDTAAEWLALLAAVNTDATSATHATTYVTLEAGTASDDAYNGQTISVTDATDGHAETRRIEDYTSGRLVTFDRALSFTPVQDDIIRIYDMPYNAIAAIAGGTANTYIVTDTGAAGGNAIPDVFVWLTIDSAGARLITSGVTDDNGEVVFYLDSGITYYVWMTKSGWSFSDNGEAWVAD
ncbi:MAG TPA: hypothetical protein ENI05_11640 [Porticoccus sp.]|nr:hypothetical protein [Porticoccus sp.]